MKVGELIHQLQVIESECGEIDVRFIGTLPEDPEQDDIAIAGVTIVVNEDGEAVSALICDDLTLDLFADGETL